MNHKTTLNIFLTSLLTLFPFLVSCSEELGIRQGVTVLEKPLVVQVEKIEIIEQKPDVPNLSRKEVIAKLLSEIEKQTKEMLPFDEPRTEVGQQDGMLRAQWWNAYRHGKSMYTFNGDRYMTMYKGRPHVPQVCADFIVDSIDRTAGTWYYPTLKHPRIIIGNYWLRKEVKNAELNPRRIADLSEFFRTNPEHFEIVFEGNGERVGSLKKLQVFFKQYNTQLGDIVFIKGRVPWDQKEHSHSFFVTELDKNAFVTKVTGNPIYPVQRSLKAEGGRTPKRCVTHIIRLTDEFLKEITK